MAFHLNPHSTIIFPLFFQKLRRLSIDVCAAEHVESDNITLEGNLPARAEKRSLTKTTQPAALAIRRQKKQKPTKRPLFFTSSI
ncbi:hypothetical protein B1691_11770 [Geobacillus sp. 47C-IIb]|jgi:hypothetical protein|nr:hypothetical protein GD3902_01800 [Geobacillus thermodenitrificans]ATO36154.1 hypothetical protein GTID1_02360 [Geobacillus thermodenitrificans]OQP09196.1 hypothetical protein B1691_11770 [Geobacillus sp. 47C-IIb]PJW20548.1 hypothetical protein CV632_08430 [Geobacillus thermodenitrificans]